MTEAERGELRRLLADKAFLAFLYRMVRSAGVFSAAAPDARSLEYIEGRRSLALELLNEVNAAQDQQSPDGLPLWVSIQILVGAAQMATKEKSGGRRSDPYRELGDGNGD
jgi:hypothetical protein